jgi:CubicO group peptidase (beta-lactamase class C family)
MTGLAATDPVQSGFDPARLARLDGFLDRLTEDGRIPGWSLAIARHRTLVHTSTGGYRDLEAGLPVEAGTLFRIYSMTKPVTAVAALLLCERGDLELSDPVARFIPSFASLRVYAGGPDQRPVTEPAIRLVTVRHLLTHTAGLTYGFHRAHPVDALYRQAGHDIEAPPGCSLAEACDTWAGLPLLFQPGSEWNYSVGTDVLGRVVEVVAGQSLGEFCAGQIFTPLGMPDTTFTVPAADLPRSNRTNALGAVVLQ